MPQNMNLMKPNRRDWINSSSIQVLFLFQKPILAILYAHQIEEFRVDKNYSK
jgi:hypothetical protein